MSRRCVLRVIFIAGLLLSLEDGAIAQGGPGSSGGSPPPPGMPPPPPGAPPLPGGELRELPRAELVGSGVRIGGVLVDPVKREVTVPCELNMREGLLEYALVGETGKRYESLLMTRVEPYDIQVALLLLGLKGGRPLEAQGDPRKPEGDPVRLWVQWQEGAEIKNVRIETLIRNSKLDKEMAETNWVFTGSRMREGAFMAQIERSLIAIFHDPAAIVDNPLQEGGDDTLWFVNTGRTPPVGTAVTLKIQAVN